MKQENVVTSLAVPSFEYLRHPVRLTDKEKTAAVARVRRRFQRFPVDYNLRP